jgi:hypothetical protein
MTRFCIAVEAMPLAIAPARALDGQPAMRDPSTVIESGGRCARNAAEGSGGLLVGRTLDRASPDYKREDAGPWWSSAVIHDPLTQVFRVTPG